MILKLARSLCRHIQKASCNNVVFETAIILAACHLLTFLVNVRMARMQPDEGPTVAANLLLTSLTAVVHRVVTRDNKDDFNLCPPTLEKRFQSEMLFRLIEIKTQDKKPPPSK